METVQISKMDFKAFLDYFLWKSPIRLFLLITTTLLSYGWMLFFHTVNNDMCWNMYSCLTPCIEQKRWGWTILANLGLTDRCIPFWSNGIGLLLLVLGVLLLAFLWMKISDGFFTGNTLLVFVLLFISYPLLCSIYIYPNMLIINGLSYAFVAYSLLKANEAALLNANIKSLILPILLLTITFSGYESFVVFYLTCCGLWAYYRVTHTPEISWKNLIYHFRYAIFIFTAALILRGIGIFIASLMVHYAANGGGAAKAIVWLDSKYSVSYTIWELLGGFFYDYVYSVFFNWGVFVFMISAILWLLLIFKKSFSRGKAILLIIAVLFSCFTFSFLQGVVQPHRICQSFPVFIGFVWMLWSAEKLRFQKLFFVIVAFLIFLQTKELNLMYELDRNMSSRIETLFSQVGHELEKIPGIRQKKIIFIGDGQSWRFLPKYEDTITHPLLKNLPKPPQFIWQGAGWCHYGNSASMAFLILFRNLTGLDVERMKKEELKIIADQHRNMPEYPQKGSISDEGNRVIVNWGQVEIQIPPSPYKQIKNIIRKWNRIRSI